MRHRVTRWIWQLPAAIHYAFSLLLSASMVLARWNLTTYLGDRAPFTFAFMSVLIASFVGGFGPGLLAALIWLLLGLPLFLPPILSFDIIDPRHGWLLASNALLWVLTAAMCHQLRQAVIRGDEVASRLQLQGEKLSAVIDSITDGFFAAASDWTITRSNQRFHDHFDVKPPPSGQNLWTSTGIGDIAIVRQALETAMSKRIFQSVELNIEIDHRWLQIRCHPTGDKGIFCILQDITERKRLEEHRKRCSRTSERLAVQPSKRAT